LRQLSLFLLLIASLLADTNERNVSYKISYGIFGKLGNANASIKIDSNSSYIITLQASATGVASILSLGKKEIYESKGEYKDGKFIPQIYTKRVENLIKKRVDTHIIDHGKKTISRHRIINEQVGDHWREYETNTTLPYFAPNDILSLFFNISFFVSDFKSPKSYTLYAVGASNETGRIDIIIPQKDQKKQLQKSLQTTLEVAKVSIHQEIFSSKSGELLIAMREDGICAKALLQDVLLFGDIIGEIDEQK
jgi:hypothetical protein